MVGDLQWYIVYSSWSNAVTTNCSVSSVSGEVRLWVASNSSIPALVSCSAQHNQCTEYHTQAHLHIHTQIPNLHKQLHLIGPEIFKLHCHAGPITTYCQRLQDFNEIWSPHAALAVPLQLLLCNTLLTIAILLLLSSIAALSPSFITVCSMLRFLAVPVAGGLDSGFSFLKYFCLSCRD